MGKGDRKTAKGKRYNSSYGNARSRGVAAKSIVSAGDKVAVTKKAPAAKAAAKTVAKKATKVAKTAKPAASAE